MKRLINLLVVFCCVFLAISLFLRYSDQTYEAVFAGKDVVYIDQKEDQTAEAFLAELREVSDATACGLFYSTIEDASRFQSTFRLYTSSLSEAFLPLTVVPAEETAAELLLSTDPDDAAAEGTIVCSNFLYDFKLYDLDAACEYDLSHALFYVESTGSEAFTAEIMARGYDVALGENEKLDGVENFTDLENLLLVLTIALFFCMIAYSYSLKYEMIVRKANGYGELQVFLSLFGSELLWLLLCGTLTYLVSLALFATQYPLAVSDYIGFSAGKSLLYAGLTLVMLLVAGIFMQFRVSPMELRKPQASGAIFAFAMAAKLFVLIAAGVILSGAVSSVILTQRYLSAQTDIAFMAEDYVTVSLNVGSADFDGNEEEYRLKTISFVNRMAEQYDAVIVDSSEFGTTTSDVLPFLYVNANYFRLNPITLSDGSNASDLTFDTDGYTVLLPEGFDGDLVITDDTTVYYYQSGQEFLTFNDFAVSAGASKITDPVVVLENQELLEWSAEYIIGEYYLLIPGVTYSDIKADIVEEGLGPIILEAQTVGALLDEDTLLSVSTSVQYILLSLLHVAAFLILLSFETVTYVTKNRYRLAVKKLNGFGLRTYFSAYLTRLFELPILLAATYFVSLSIPVALFLWIIDCVLFTLYLHKSEDTSIYKYLKEDE